MVDAVFIEKAHACMYIYTHWEWFGLWNKFPYWFFLIKIVVENSFMYCHILRHLQASTLTFVRLSGTSENWRQISRSCITVVRRNKWKNDSPTFWRLFSMIKMCCFVIFTDLIFINDYFNVLIISVSIEVHYR
jgi:hypothetical protein